MGYQTNFQGSFKLNRPLTEAHKAYLTAFANTRRMRRDVINALLLDDPIREAAYLPVGPEGAYFVGGKGFAGQDKDKSILDYNNPPTGQPGLWCKWTPNEDGTAIEWNQAEKFYDYVEWIQYLIQHFLGPWGYQLSGTVTWQGEEPDDRGTIHIADNLTEITYG